MRRNIRFTRGRIRHNSVSVLLTRLKFLLAYEKVRKSG
jgi:stalled ribosome alternative rescue factor ArfA